MRKPVMAGNWKMNKTRDEALEFIYAVSDKLPSASQLDSIVCAPAIILRDLVKRKGNNLKIGAQNVHFAESGAYTGEISPVMLTSTGVEYVIIGHSERRAYFNETDETVNLKVKAALANDLKPIICCGESLEEREANTTHDVLDRQITKAFEGIDNKDLSNIIIAYEPIWAIGTGKVASAEMADEACGYIRSLIAKLYCPKCAEGIRILYGGSVSTKSVSELMAQPNIDGGLVGGASLQADSFIELCNKAI
ncbi:MAG: triose-phosphate isomerase [Anaeroplasmataceae bacterium]|nr:triose-phosphate isomerase [Anaeroplasmataceae bacterium]MDE6241207.1 triose-phosphate isomerase [Anaeroplasmataceae bacterium]MDE7385018.1 triose-phosphate isomerase [Anaeroplasmataceae bacterium]